MRVYHRTMLVPGMFALAMPIVVAAWLVTVPTVIATSSFVACVLLLTAVGWVVQRTYVNVQPAATLAQSLHDSDQISSGAQQGRNR